MIDPQGGIWTPIDEGIVVTGPRTGTLLIHLMEAPFKAWNFYISGTFEESKEYPLNLTEGIPGAGVALTDLVIEPDYFQLGEAMTISVTAINNEDTDMGKEIIFIIDSTEVGRETVDLGPGESKTVSIEVIPSQIGTFTVKVDALTARFEVKEPYPEISKPTVKTIRWTGERNVYGGPCFQGEIFLPEPGKDQGYFITPSLKPEGDDRLGGAEVTYISNGLWKLIGSAGIAHYSPHKLCPFPAERWHVSCPLCGWQHQTGIGQVWMYPNIETFARNALQGHAELTCYEGGTEHCGLDVSNPTFWITQETGYYLSSGPCKGTVMTLTLNVAIYGPSGGDPPFQLVREWQDIPTGLSHTILWRI